MNNPGIMENIRGLYVSMHCNMEVRSGRVSSLFIKYTFELPDFNLVLGTVAASEVNDGVS